MARQLRKQIEQAADPTEIAALKADLHIAEVDSHYARYFPFLEAYVSLYPLAKKAKESKTDEDEETDEKSLAKLALHAPRPPLWSTIEQAMEQGQGALEKLRDRDTAAKLAEPKSRKLSTPKAKPVERNKAASGANSEAVSGKGKGAAAAAKRKEADDSDDGGFFEEG
jgi:hypothetical protein